MPIYTYSEYDNLPDNKKLKRNNYYKPIGLTGEPIKFEVIDTWDETFGNYAIGCYGVLENGIKTKLLLKDVETTFDVLVPEFINDMADNKQKIDGNSFFYMLKGLFESNKINSMKTPYSLYEYKFTEFEEKPSLFLRLSFGILKERNQAIKLCNEAKYMTAFDDGDSFKPPHAGYPRKVARERNINFAGMNIIKKYNISKAPHGDYFNGDGHYVPENIVYILEASVADISPVPLSRDFKSVAIAALCDIETYCDPSRSFPNSMADEDEIFIASTSFCQISRVKPLDDLIVFQLRGLTAEQSKSILCENSDTNNPYQTASIVIACSGEEELLKCFISIYGAILPDMWIDFNGLDFDQKYFFNRFNKYKVLDKYWNKFNRLTIIPIEGTKSWTLLDEFKCALYSPFDPVERPFINQWGSNWGSRFIKVNPSKVVIGDSFKMPGMFYFDARPILMRANDKESESSLKHFLKIMGLPPKHDMPALAMFRLFENPRHPYTLAGKTYTFRALIEYAAYDAASLHLMLTKQNIYIRSISNAILTQTTLLDAYYEAGGIKVINMIMATAFHGVKDIHGQILPVAFSVKYLKRVEKEFKPPGAYVKPPVFHESGRCPYPLAPLDFSSLYPSIIMAYNISWEKLIFDKQKAAELSARYKIKENKFQLGPDEIQTWIVQYNFDEKSTEVGMGILPIVLDQLKINRDDLKKDLDKIKDDMDLAKKKNATADEMDELNRQRGVLDGMQKEVKVQMNTFYGVTGRPKFPFYVINITGTVTSIGQELWKYADSLVAEKKFTTVYGDTDSIYSYADPAIYQPFINWHDQAVERIKSNNLVIQPPPIYDSISPNLISWAKKIAETDLALIPKWADIQSNIQLSESNHVHSQQNKQLLNIAPEYQLHPDIYNPEIDIAKRLRLLKEDLYSRMVIIAQFLAAELEKYVNLKMAEYSGTKRLKMAYEEVLFPACLFGKKKYLGVQNIKPDRRLIGFDWSKREHNFLKGLDFIKRGTAPIMKDIGEELIKEFTDIMETRTIKQIVEQKIKTLSDREWDPNRFIQTAEYKLDKKNVKVHSFVHRMERLFKEQELNIKNAADHGLIPPPSLYRVPLPGERFEFVIVKKTNLISTYGRKMTIKVGDKMEFPEVVQVFGYKIDIDHYIKNSIVGLLARFISYDTMFRNIDIADYNTNNQTNNKNVSEINKNKQVNNAELTNNNNDDNDDDDNDDNSSVKSEEDSKEDAIAIQLARKHINGLMTQPIGKDALKISKQQSKLAISNIQSKTYVNLNVFFKYSSEIDKYYATGKDTPPLTEMIISMAKDESKKYKIDSNKLVADLKKKKIGIDTLHKVYNTRQKYINNIAINNLTHVRQIVLNNKESALLAELQTIEASCWQINTKFAEYLNNGNQNNNLINDSEKIVINKLSIIYNELIGIYSMINSIADTSKLISFSRTKIIEKPIF